MKELLQNLVELQSLEFGGSKGKTAQGTIAELRGKIPAPILAHYDRLMVRGKKGIATVQNQVCTGCHMRLPMGIVMNLMHGRDIQLCDCGRYLYLPPESAAPTAAPVVEIKPAKKPRSRAVVAA